MTTSSPNQPRGGTATDRTSAFAEELARDRQHREKARTLQPLRRLVPFILRYPGLLAAFVVFLIAASALTLMLPAAFRLVVDCGFAGALAADSCTVPMARSIGTGQNLGIFFVAGMGVAVALGLASALRYYFISRLGERVVADLRRAVFAHLVTLSPKFYADVRTGEVLSRLTTDTTLIQTLVGSSISVAIRTLATTLGALILMIVVNWKLALMVLVLGPIILGPIILFGQRVQRLSRSGQDSLAGASARAGESLMAIETVQAFTREDEEVAGFARAVEETYRVAHRRIVVRAVMTSVLFSLVLSGLIAVLWFGALQVQNGAMTPGTMTQFVMYAFVAVSGVGFLTETYTEVMRAAGATERLIEILHWSPDITAPAAPALLPSPVRGGLTLGDVHFAYPSRPDNKVLNGLSLTVEPGETVALVGPSGAGKSTVFQLLLRFYDPDAGTISIDGTDIKSITPQALRKTLAIVQQNAPLFSGNVNDNILYGRLTASQEDVRAAAIAANADGFIRALSNGYETELGESAQQLSGGQRQRLSIARAILRNAPILLLDEATSALDSESERAVQQAFEEISKDRTTLVIAHRLSTVLHADRILVMDEGKVVETGTHSSLMAANGLYARFAKLQFGAPGVGPAAIVAE
ncbi:MAG: ABC transporter transmembrane domain-containing protein [Pseudomonadota bacterium]